MRAPVSRYAGNCRRINPVILVQMTLAAGIAIRMTGSELVPPDTLARAERLATAILAHAGVPVRWLRCRPGLPDNPCGAPPGRADLLLEILPRIPSNRSAEGTGFTVIQPTDAGFAGYAAVSYPRVVAVAGECDQDVPIVLGTSIVHEIGHLLLGPKAHSSGVMSARLGCQELRRASRGDLWFAPDQARRMRAEVARRR